jgi:NhaA family Na+:H+ antiporter
MKHVVRGNRTRREPPLERILLPFEEFTHAEASSGILLLLCTVIALVWANSPWASTYTSLWQTKISIGVGSFALAKPLLLWINDGLMAVFFFVVGLEIKREVLVGELASLRQALLPITAALGGVLVPATLYSVLNAGEPGAPGWGIPMATDIAFALGVMVLLGNRVPVALKVFLTALAIVDDIAAVLVIALFYTAEIAWASLAVGTGFFILLLIANLAGARHPMVYAGLGVGLWLAFLLSGVHATVAGVLLAMTIPARTRIDADEFLARSRALLGEFERASGSSASMVTRQERREAIQALETACQQVETPMQRLEHALHPWVTFAIMPLFALANAGVSPGGDLSEALTHPVALGIIAGLVVGKPLGVTLFTWLAVRIGVTGLPAGVTWRQVHGAGWLAGIGFTMSLFIANLAFGDTRLLSMAKVGILTASLIAGMVGWVILRLSQTSKTASGAQHDSVHRDSN